ncbi:MAG: hypothetical protein II625_07345 [Bacilli bacterium]|nr:hypothetical protein [Bacilli bacterium]
MPIRKYINLNDYTLLKDSAKETINFFPESAILKQKVEKTKDTLYINFEIEKDPKTKVNIMYVTLISSDNEELYKSYSIYLKEISLYKYIILDSINDYADAEVMPSLIIDFNKLNYNNFLDILSKNKDLSRMIPELKKALENDIKALSDAKNIAEIINIQSPLNYYQNVTGFLINEIETLIANENEEEISRTILKTFKKKYEIALKDPNQINLSFLSLLANVLSKIKSNNLTPKKVLETNDLKTDTNKEYITYKDLNNILNSIIEKEKSRKPIPGDLNIIQERIVYLIETKPRIKEFTKLLKVIVSHDKYLGDNKRVRTVDETKLKDILIKALTNLTYRTLPRNQILIYNLEENVDFIAIISQDMIAELLGTYYINRNTSKEYLDMYKRLNEIVSDPNPKKDELYLKILVNNIIAMNLYYYKNVSNNILLIDKGDAIINLDYKEGEYDISIINKNTNKKYASLSKINEDTKDLIKIELRNGEKNFTSLINKIIYQNLYSNLTNLSIEITIDELTHKGIIVKFPKTLKEDVFSGEVDLETLLLIFTQLKELKKKKVVETEELAIPEPEPVQEEEPTMKQEEINQIIRKASAIAEVMNTRPINNENYKKIAEIYNEYRATKNEELLPTLKEALEKK